MTLAIVFSREIAATASDSTRLRDLGATRLERAASSAAGSLIAASLGALLTVAGAIAIVTRVPDRGCATGRPGHWCPRRLAGARRRVRRDRACTQRNRTRHRVEGHEQTPDDIAPPDRGALGGIEPARADEPPAFGWRSTGRGLGGSVPVRAACAGAAVGIIGVIAALVFSASLDSLVASPGRFGAPWQFVVQDTTSNTPCGSGDYGLARHDGIADLTELCTQQIDIAGRPIAALTFARRAGDPLTPVVVAGRLPVTTREIALGAKTLAALHRHIGDHVTITRGRVTRHYRIVGRAVLPTLTAAEDLGDGAVFTSVGYAPLFDQNLFSRYFVGRYATGIAPTSVRRSVDAIPQLGPVTAPPVPSEIARLRQIGWLPTALALLLGTLGLIAVGHALVTAVRRRRREFAVLKTLGFDRRQVRATVGWQATTLAVIGLVPGVPLGLLAGGARLASTRRQSGDRVGRHRSHRCNHPRDRHRRGARERDRAPPGTIRRRDPPCDGPPVRVTLGGLRSLRRTHPLGQRQIAGAVTHLRRSRRDHRLRYAAAA